LGLGDRPTTCHRKKKKTAKETKLWPHNSQTDGNRCGQWKRNHEMRIETWNVRPLHTAGAVNKLVKEMDKYKADICTLQEIRWSGTVAVIKQKELYNFT